MSLPRVVAVTPGSPAARAGLLPGDEIVTMDGQLPRDIIQYQLLADQPELDFEIRRAGLERLVTVRRSAVLPVPPEQATVLPVPPEQAAVLRSGSAEAPVEPTAAGVTRGVEPLGIEVDAALFDRVRTCDNHCEFCFIHQLPKGMRKSLYTRDDDYRLSFLYGNFTTLTRFTEADLERVITEGLSPLWVSIHATDPAVRSRMLRNPRGATSLRWLRALLDHGVDVHGQVVVCPGVNDGVILDDTLAGVLDLFPDLLSVACVPLGVSRFNVETSMRPHTPAEATAAVELIEGWQTTFVAALGRPMVHASDEFYLQAGRALPPLATYGELAQHDNGVGMIRAFEARFDGRTDAPEGGPGGFFQSVDGAPAEGYRAPRAAGSLTFVRRAPAADAPVAVLTGTYAKAVLEPLVARVRPDARVIAVDNEFFGGNTAVAGLLTGPDLARVLADQPVGHRYLLPDVCLSGGRFLDGTSPDDLPRPVEIVPADGAALRRALTSHADELAGAGAGAGAGGTR